jgi:hypothetical protein
MNLTRPNGFAVAAAVGVAALAMNSGVGWKLGMARPMESDALYFRDIAEHLAAGKGFVARESFWPGRPTMQRLPAWPFTVSLALRLAPDAPPDAAMRVTAAVVHALAAAALALLAFGLFGRASVGLLAGVFYALHPTGLHAADSGLSEPLFMLLAAAGSLCLLRAAGRMWLMAAGVIMGFACLIRPNFLLWGVAMAAWVAVRWARRRGEDARRFALALAVGAAFALPAVGWMARNARVCGHFPVLSTLRGQTFYGGNNEVVARRGEFWGYWVFPNLIPGETPLVELARTRSEWEVDDYYFRKGVAFVKANGPALPGLAAGKLVRAYWPFPRKLSRTGLAVGAFRALLWAAALTGLALAWRRLPRSHVANLAAMAAANVGTVLIFWGNARFAFEFEAVLAPFAAMGAVGLWDRIRGRGANGA